MSYDGAGPASTPRSKRGVFVSPRSGFKAVSAVAVAASALVWQACRPDSPFNDGSIIGPPSETVSITLAWDAPNTDAQGQPLQDLAGYRIYYGKISPLDRTRDSFVDVGLVATFTVGDLEPGTYFFAVAAVDDSGNESVLSGEIGAELTLP